MIKMYFFPILRELLLVSGTLPSVSTATAERSLSTHRRLYINYQYCTFLLHFTSQQYRCAFVFRSIYVCFKIKRYNSHKFVTSHYKLKDPCHININVQHFKRILNLLYLNTAYLDNDSYPFCFHLFLNYLLLTLLIFVLKTWLRSQIKQTRLTGLSY